MTSTLASQLAQIRVKSTNSLDLKAQKKTHSQSLLFEPRIAAAQDFDILYQLCHEGYIELCRLDPRFTDFSGTLFSEQSKLEDRTLMTESQNQRLDSVLEDFLGLVSCRLLLNTALQAVEWTLRRFRVHEYNTNYLVMSFLPYHTHPMFSTMLSILPNNIPQTLKFLHPYMQSVSCPPRHAIVYTASHNQAFFAALNGFVLRISRLRLDYPALLSFWASVTTEATASMLDQARSGRRETQTQRQEDVVMRVMPMLNDALSIEGIADLRVGCYMILAIISSKATLGDEALGSIMEAVVLGWEKTSHAGLICLAVLAQKRRVPYLPNRVLKALLTLKSLEGDLKVLKQQYSVDKLVLGIVFGVVDGLRKAPRGNDRGKSRGSSKIDPSDQVYNLFEADLLNRSSVTKSIEYMLSIIPGEVSDQSQISNDPSPLTELVLRLAASDSVGKFVRDNVQRSISMHAKLPQSIRALDNSIQPTEVSDTDDDPPSVMLAANKDSFDSVMMSVESLGKDEVSFLSDSEPTVFPPLSEAFVLAFASPSDLRRFQGIPVLGEALAMKEPLFFSFFIRLWCSSRSAQVRTTAVAVVSDYLAKTDLVSDVQMLLPYLLYALMDPSRNIRQSSKNLVLLLASKYRKSKEKSEKGPQKTILGQGQIYGAEKFDGQPVWLKFDEVTKFLNDVLVPHLEECLLDANYLPESLATSLNDGSQRSKANNDKRMKTSVRKAVFVFLCSQVTHTPLYNVKLRLLTILNHVKKVGTLTRAEALMPLFTRCVEENEAELRNGCIKDRIEPEQYVKALLGILSPADQDSIVALRNGIGPGMRCKAPLLSVAAFQRLRNLWSAIDPELQSTLAETLMEICVQEADSESALAEQDDAAETLETVELSSASLMAFIESLPPLINHLEDSSPAPKKRKTSHGSSPSDALTVKDALRRITIVLEIVSASRPERHPVLLKGHFQLLAALKGYRNLSGSELGYLEIMILNNASSIIDSLKDTPSSHVDRSAVRAEVLIECVGATGNPQVQQAAMLLASNIASVAPELILHNIMPLFTFAGKGVMRNNDEYSAHIIEKTMATVIPRLVESLHERKIDPVVSISELLLSFVAAYKDIPLQRRQDIFVSLTDRVGADDYLFALLVLLVDKYPDDRNVVDFATRLTAQQDCATQLITIERYFEVVLDSQKPKPTVSLHLLSSDKSKPSTTTVAALLALPTAILKKDKLQRGTTLLLSQKGDDAISGRSRYGRILEQVFTLSGKVEHDERLKGLCADALDALLRLLSLDKFVEALPELLQRTDSDIRINILLSLENRLKEHRSSQLPPQNACLAFLPHLMSVIEDSNHMFLRQAAMTCMDQIIEKFGKKDIGVVNTAATTISGPRCLEATDASIQISSLICLATIVEVLRDAFIPMIPAVFPRVMDYLASSIEEGVENPRLHNAIYTFVTALLVYLPWIVHGSSLDHLLKLSYESANAEIGDACDQLRSDAMQLAAKSVEPKEFLLALDRTWTVAMAEGPLAVKEFLELLSLVIEREAKSAVAKQSDLLANLFIKAFDLRRIQCSPRTEDSYEGGEIEEVEAAMNDSLIAMVYKLNDSVFRPIFIRFSDWANSPTLKLDKDSRVQRRITWWTFQLKFFGTLRSIVTSYVGLTLNDAVDILNTIPLENADSRLLWQRVVLTLQSAFEHDQDDFFQTPSHFGPICTALVSQLQRCAAEDSLLPDLISAITTLATTTDSPEQHKSLCSPLLQLIYNDSVAVKLAAIQCQMSLTERLGEEWLAQLSEMLPAISEGMEDEERVEMEVRKWVRRIEEILGEDIGPMLQ